MSMAETDFFFPVVVSLDRDKRCVFYVAICTRPPETNSKTTNKSRKPMSGLVCMSGEMALWLSPLHAYGGLRVEWLTSYAMSSDPSILHRSAVASRWKDTALSGGCSMPQSRGRNRHRRCCPTSNERHLNGPVSSLSLSLSLSLTCSLALSSPLYSLYLSPLSFVCILLRCASAADSRLWLRVSLPVPY